MVSDRVYFEISINYTKILKISTHISSKEVEELNDYIDELIQKKKAEIKGMDIKHDLLFQTSHWILNEIAKKYKINVHYSYPASDKVYKKNVVIR